MTIEPGDIVKAAHTHPVYGYRYTVRAVDGDQAWVTLLSTKDIAKDRVMWIDGLVKIEGDQ